MSSSPIEAVLVANRGEIARRVFRTARRMGIRCIAVFVEADSSASFVQEADEAVRLPSSYLDRASLIAAARIAGADAIHPGYGFLSERADFAQAVADAGIVWVGPPATVIAAMGDKIEAKRVANEVGVPTLASSRDLSSDPGFGYPLLVKAAAGGGGKGMRLVDSSGDLAVAVESAQREAFSAFDDGTVFLERYVTPSRHIEIQVMGDHHGNLVHFGERECSIQRRHQKIIEESPSPVVDTGMRAAMGDAAIALCRHLGYRSAGTVEFLLDEVTREFYFLEVNTRLQVEHPVTEKVTGVDLVREQLRVAGGAPLGYGQGDIKVTGHAIEARIYAEDPANDFLPSTGTLFAYRPAPEPEVRWDSGVEEGAVVGIDFDPLLSKVIAHARTRDEAAARLALALERTHLAGVTTNIDLLVATLRSPAFLAGDSTTDFLERTSLETVPSHSEITRAAIVAAMWIQERNRATDQLWGFAPSNFRTGDFPAQRIEFRCEQADLAEVAVEYWPIGGGGFKLGSGQTVLVHEWTAADIDIEVDGHRARSAVTLSNDIAYVTSGGKHVRLFVLPRFGAPTAELASGGLVAPMPGAVIEVRCTVGDQVEAGQVLVVLEAMKMEHHICAPFAATVTRVPIAVGDQVDNGALLLTIEEGGDE